MGVRKSPNLYWNRLGLIWIVVKLQCSLFGRAFEKPKDDFIVNFASKVKSGLFFWFVYFTIDPVCNFLGVYIPNPNQNNTTLGYCKLSIVILVKWFTDKDLFYKLHQNLILYFKVTWLQYEPQKEDFILNKVNIIDGPEYE